MGSSTNLNKNEQNTANQQTIEKVVLGIKEKYSFSLSKNSKTASKIIDYVSSILSTIMAVLESSTIFLSSINASQKVWIVGVGNAINCVLGYMTAIKNIILDSKKVYDPKKIAALTDQKSSKPDTGGTIMIKELRQKITDLIKDQSNGESSKSSKSFQNINYSINYLNESLIPSESLSIDNEKNQEKPLSPKMYCCARTTDILAISFSFAATLAIGILSSIYKEDIEIQNKLLIATAVMSIICGTANSIKTKSINKIRNSGDNKKGSNTEESES